MTGKYVEGLKSGTYKRRFSRLSRIGWTWSPQNSPNGAQKDEFYCTRHHNKAD